MNKILLNLISAAGLFIAPAAVAGPVVVQPKDFKIDKTNTTIYISSEILLDSLNKGTNREEWITPVIKNGADSLELPAVVVAGRNRYYQAQRYRIPEKKNIQLHLMSSSSMGVNYSTNVPYEKWMNGARLSFRVDHKGCCGDDFKPTEIVPYKIIEFDSERSSFKPTFNWITPQAEAVKQRELRGQAFIDFPVNKIVIYPDYRRNTIELAKIQATIDSVHNDKDITINALSIKGFASPEGPWDNNVRLAKGRTAALKTYVEQLYHFSPDFIATSYDPEDWGGLRAYVEKSNITNREEILTLIDSDLEPDAKNAKLENTYPEQYKFLLANVYPALRHSDYRIEYTIRSYSDPAEILTLAKTKPQNLSLQEFFLAAKTLEPGSQEYNDLFETAVRMYPASEVANLNAANVAMDRGDLVGAERYLAKAGDTPEAIYARGILCALNNDYTAARDYFRQAARLKVADAPAALDQLDELEK
ncbi:MAG: hypothetical protein HDS50_02025 [Bacteroides sp.]|nr:hypothetical protein [Bacteroides sp.]